MPIPGQRVGELRPSQIIFTFGPGAIVDLQDMTAMIGGLDQWPDGPKIFEPRLEKVLRVACFRSPVPTDFRSALPVRRFPRYTRCPRCHRLYEEADRCPSCSLDTHPARFVLACERGHIQDFPWFYWVHRGSACSTPELKLSQRGRTGSMGDLIVTCACGARESMAGALSENVWRGLGYTCKGRRPWLGDTKQCDRIPVGLLVGSTNAYFGLTASALSIPPWTSELQQELNKHWESLESLLGAGKEKDSWVLKRLFPSYPLGEVETAVAERGARSEDPLRLRREEWGVFHSGGDMDQADFSTKQESVPAALKTTISRVVAVERVREVLALTGFTRLSPPDPDSVDEVNRAPLSKNELNWLPAVETHGEGLFLEINEELVANWENSPPVRARVEELLAVYQAWRQQRGLAATEPPAARFVLLHTLSHLLIRQLCLDSGYSSVAIRERLYAGPSMAGILLYTCSSGSDGSLGGLVRQVRPERLAPTWLRAIDSARLCSADPLCGENRPSLTGKLNGAACHACTLLPETSCEFMNRLLDRALVVPLPASPDTALFP